MYLLAYMLNTANEMYGPIQVHPRSARGTSELRIRFESSVASRGQYTFFHFFFHLTDAMMPMHLLLLSGIILKTTVPCTEIPVFPP